jgi:hypothetical protein
MRMPACIDTWSNLGHAKDRLVVGPWNLNLLQKCALDSRGLGRSGLLGRGRAGENQRNERNCKFPKHKDSFLLIDGETFGNGYLILCRRRNSYNKGGQLRFGRIRKKMPTHSSRSVSTHFSSLARCLQHPLRRNDFARRCASRWTVYTEPHKLMRWHEYKYLVAAEKHPVSLQVMSPLNLSFGGQAGCTNAGFWVRNMHNYRISAVT